MTKMKKWGNGDIAWIQARITENDGEFEQLKAQLNSLHLSSTTLAELEVGDQVRF